MHFYRHAFALQRNVVSYLQSGVQNERADRLLVIGQGGAGLARDEVPQSDGRVVTAYNKKRKNGPCEPHTTGHACSQRSNETSGIQMCQGAVYTWL